MDFVAMLAQAGRGMPLLPYLEIVTFLIQHVSYIVAFGVVAACVVRKVFRPLVLLSPLLVLGTACACLAAESHWAAERQGYNPNTPSLSEAVEAYIRTGEGDLYEILDGKKFPPVFGKIELQHILSRLLQGTLLVELLSTSRQIENVVP